MTLYLYEQEIKRESIEEGIKIGRQEGIKEGIKEERELAIRKMLKILSPEEVIDLGYDKALVMNIVNEV